MKRWERLISESPSQEYCDQVMNRVTPLLELQKQNHLFLKRAWFETAFKFALSLGVIGIFIKLYQKPSRQSEIELNFLEDLTDIDISNDSLIYEDFELLNEFEMFENFEEIEKWT